MTSGLTGGPDAQVVVVGAGPVGLMLAGELRLGGADVIVVETLDAPTTESRASVLHARTMEILDSRGLLGRFGELPSTCRGHFGGIPLDLTLPGPYPGMWKVPQTRTEAVLEEWVRSLGADVRRGHRLTSLRAHEDGVEAEVETAGGTKRLRCEYLVGCDGENSTVRRLAGIRTEGRGPQRELLRADVAGLTIRERRFERAQHGLANAARNGEGVTRLMVHEFGAPAAARTGEVTFADVCATWKRVAGEDVSGGTPLWVNSFTDVNRLASRYLAGRILIAGDAAHQQMPIGGQALNLGLQDAVNLGWKLAFQVRGTAAEGLLASYETERRAVGRRTLDNIHAQAQLLLGGQEADGLRALWKELLTEEAVRVRLAGMISGQDTRCEVPGDGHPLLGRPLPHTEVTTAAGGPATTTAALLRQHGGLLLDLSGDPGKQETSRQAARGWADRISLVEVTVPPGSPLEGCSSLLARPDGHLVWAGEEDAAGLAQALHRWFGAPVTEAASPASASAPAASGPGRNEASSGPAAGTAEKALRVAGPAHTTQPHGLPPQRSRPAPSTSTLRSRRRFRMARFTGKTALVTGSSRGMGRAAAVRLAREDALVAVHYAGNKEAAEETVATIEKDGGSAFAVCADLRNAGGVHDLFLSLEENLKTRTGDTRLDVLVNNAGIMGGVEPEATTPEMFDEIFAVNAKAPFFLIQRALRNIPDGGRIINISSGLTRMANPQEIAYSMSKGAVEQLALHFAKHLGPRGITVNSVAPGITRNTDPVFGMPEVVEEMAKMSAFNRVGEPEDIADVVAFLASDDARWITGAFVDASGGTLLG